MEIVGKVVLIIFEGENSYKILKTKTQDKEDVIIKGYFPIINLESYYKFICDVKFSSKYGQEYISKSYRLHLDKSKEGIVSYFDNFVDGVGKKTAEKIYDLLGYNAIDLIIEDKNVLKKIKGLSQKKIEFIYDSLKKNKESNDVYVSLIDLGLSSQNVSKIFMKYQNDSLKKINENPYILIKELDNFGFKKADEIAMHIGISSHNVMRISECVLYILNHLCYESGNTYSYKEDLVYNALEYLNHNSNEYILDNEVLDVISSLSESNKIILEDDRIYPISLYRAEVGFVEELYRIKNLLHFRCYDKHLLDSKLMFIEQTYNIIYTSSQKEAIFSAINNKISIITGGPGTGKTTIVKAIINLFALIDNKSITDDKFRRRLLLCAPTGRAAMRLGRECNVVSKTIHKALGYTESCGFEYDEFNKINEDIIVIDEFSMVDIELAYALFKAIKTNAFVIILGDSMQLPSVGPGNVLKELIDSTIINSKTLKEIMRQDKDSSIVSLCKDITFHLIDYNLFLNKKDLYFYEVNSKNSKELIIKIVDRFIKGGGNIFEDLQILIPMYAGIVGIDSINKEIQEKFNNNQKKIVRGSKVFKENDKVIQLKNDPDKGIMNGDIGRIISINSDKKESYLMILFDNIKVKYAVEDLDDLDLAYAISIHKAQGSEFKNVIVPILYEYNIMLRIKLIYTAFSRAKEKLIVLGSFDALKQSLLKEEVERQTTLLNRLIGFKKEEKKDNIILIEDKTIPFKELKEIGAYGITPYDFLEKEKDNF